FVFARVGWSVVGKRRERTPDVAVAPHASDGVLPPALHLREGVLVRVVSVDDGGPEVGVLQLDHLIGGGAAKREVTRPAQLTTGHRLHDRFSIRFGPFGRHQYSPLITKYEPRIVPASFDFCRANLNETSSSGTSMPSESLNPTARLPGSSSVYRTLIDSPFS